jgi:hypothetical protein
MDRGLCFNFFFDQNDAKYFPRTSYKEYMMFVITQIFFFVLY